MLGCVCVSGTVWDCVCFSFLPFHFFPGDPCRWLRYCFPLLFLCGSHFQPFKYLYKAHVIRMHVRVCLFIYLFGFFFHSFVYYLEFVFSFSKFYYLPSKTAHTYIIRCDAFGYDVGFFHNSLLLFFFGRSLLVIDSNLEKIECWWPNEFVSGTKKVADRIESTGNKSQLLIRIHCQYG